MAANPYVEARREWDERYADLVLGKRNWQIGAGRLLALGLILASGIIWLTTRSRYIPYVVEVDKLGYALTVPQPLTPSALPDVTARMRRYEVAAFIRNARVLAASNRQIDRAIRDGLIREDQYYRLKVCSLPLPPLRERIEDLPLLVGDFVRRTNEERAPTDHRHR